MTATPVPLQPGERVKLRMPWSEVCMHLKVAGRVMEVELLEGGEAAQLYDEEGDPFSFPILPGEAGIFRHFDKPTRFYTVTEES